ncbi:MFS transporter [Streptomyces smyrnaeus]|uniref:MFS transporter n=1 Tax=Streptomyces smyrnaeus TaxID=1387713 RepID=UPI0033B02E7D
MRKTAGILLSPTRHLDTDQRNRLRRMAGARFLSELGTKAAFAALVLRVTELTTSATVLSIVLTATVIADAAVTPIAGIVGDLFNRRAVMIASDLAAAVLYLALGFMQDLWLLAVVAAMATAVESFYFPASGAAVPNLFDKASLGVVNATFSQARTAGAISGPLVAALLTTQFGAGPVFWLNAVTFAVSAFLVSGVSGEFKASSLTRSGTESSNRSAGHVRGFLRILREHPIVPTFIALWITIQLGTGALWVALPKLAAELGSPSTAYATLLTASTIGSFLGAFAAARVLALTTPAKLLIGALIAEAALLLGAGSAAVLVIAVGAMVGFRAAESASGAASYTIFQSVTEDDVRARASAWVDTATIAAFGIGVALAGPLVDAVGPRYVFATASVCVTGGVGFAWRMTKQVRGLGPMETCAT